MRKTISYSLIFLFSSCLLVSCGPQKTENDASAQTEQSADAVRSMPDYAYTDSLMQGSHKVIFSITSQADTTLAIVEDEDGTRYRDNRYTLTVTKDGQKLFSRSLTKADFRSQLPDDFQRLGIMDGMRFKEARDGKLIFSTCVSLPDSDMSCPFLLTIGPDGSHTITPDTSDPEEDELPPTHPEDTEAE